MNNWVISYDINMVTKVTNDPQLTCPNITNEYNTYMQN